MRVQLSRQRSIAGAVATVTAALLGNNAIAAPAPGKVESALLFYSEAGRVKAAEGILGGTLFLAGDRILNAKLTFDGLTGASPNGATPSRQIQTFTRPSGSGSYQVASGNTPLDDTFRDTRVALDIGITQPLGRLTSGQLGGHFSTEHDYTSFGINAGLTRDLFEKNTTLGISGAYSHELVRPVGSSPLPLSSMPPSSDSVGGEDEDEGEGGPAEKKNVIDLLLGITQVIDRNTIARFNYSYSHSSGYLNDPYKLISVVQAPASADPGEPVDYLYERRPDLRNKQSLYGQVRHYFGGSTADLSYRYFWDDWGIRSQTVDFFYRWQFNGESALQPHFRWYHQTEADFYRTFLVQGVISPDYVSADYRLANFDAYTLGLQYSLPLRNGSRISFGGEYYMQRGDTSPPEAYGSLMNFELFPNMDAIMFRIGFEHAF